MSPYRRLCAGVPRAGRIVARVVQVGSCSALAAPDVVLAPLTDDGSWRGKCTPYARILTAEVTHVRSPCPPVYAAIRPRAPLDSRGGGRRLESQLLQARR